MSSTEAVTTARTKTSLQEPRPPAQSLASTEAGPAPELPVCCGTGVGPRGAGPRCILTVASARTPKPDESVIQPHWARKGGGRNRQAREARTGGPFRGAWGGPAGPTGEGEPSAPHTVSRGSGKSHNAASVTCWPVCAGTREERTNNALRDRSATRSRRTVPTADQASPRWPRDTLEWT